MAFGQLHSSYHKRLISNCSCLFIVLSMKQNLVFLKNQNQVNMFQNQTRWPVYFLSDKKRESKLQKLVCILIHLFSLQGQMKIALFDTVFFNCLNSWNSFKLSPWRFSQLMIIYTCQLGRLWCTTRISNVGTVKRNCFIENYDLIFRKK